MSETDSFPSFFLFHFPLVVDEHHRNGDFLLCGVVERQKQEDMNEVVEGGCCGYGVVAGGIAGAGDTLQASVFLGDVLDVLSEGQRLLTAASCRKGVDERLAIEKCGGVALQQLLIDVQSCLGSLFFW